MEDVFVFTCILLNKLLYTLFFLNLNSNFILVGVVHVVSNIDKFEVKTTKDNMKINLQVHK